MKIDNSCKRQDTYFAIFKSNLVLQDHAESCPGNMGITTGAVGMVTYLYNSSQRFGWKHDG